MTVAILTLIVSCAVFWLVYFKLKLLRLTPGRAMIFTFVVLHVCTGSQGQCGVGQAKGAKRKDRR